MLDGHLICSTTNVDLNLDHTLRRCPTFRVFQDSM